MTEQNEIEPAPARNVFDFEALMPTGILWLINRTVFHPRGLALSIAVPADGGPCQGWEIVASPDGSPYHFSDAVDEAAKHRAVEELLDLARLHGVMPPRTSEPAAIGERVEIAIKVDPGTCPSCGTGLADAAPIDCAIPERHEPPVDPAR